eukprot:TRINITY_DN50703_c0_g1_i1.p1 TRINITY_DN50703_c0_g1~~TRINITY_DN50703_c0_g1_i1.p1  ORF type:complete len:526 (+),score=57.47 TRINITY_DN50703_c0_g1_i1:128-1579(+)
MVAYNVQKSVFSASQGEALVRLLARSIFCAVVAVASGQGGGDAAGAATATSRNRTQCWAGADFRLRRVYPHIQKEAPYGSLMALNVAREFCCHEKSRFVRCNQMVSHCMSLDDEEFGVGAICWPKWQGRSASWTIAKCCDGDRLDFFRTQIPLWMQREVDDDFAPWTEARITRAQLDAAELAFGHVLCRLTIRHGRLHIGKTQGCTPRYFGPNVVRDMASTVNALLGAGILRHDLDFLVLKEDFESDLPQDLPVFAHGAARCQRGVILVPLNDCMTGLVESFWRETNGGPAPTTTTSRSEATDSRLVWRGTVRGFTRCSPSGSETCTCQTWGEENASRLRHSPRSRLVELARRHPDEIAASGKGFHVDWSRFLFHVSVDATAYNTLAIWRPLLLGRVLVKQTSDIDVAWFRHGLKEFVHYLPVSFGLDNLRKRLAWARAHPNETENIRREGHAFAREILTRCRLFARMHVHALLQKYAGLQSF